MTLELCNGTFYACRYGTRQVKKESDLWYALFLGSNIFNGPPWLEAPSQNNLADAIRLTPKLKNFEFLNSGVINYADDRVMILQPISYAERDFILQEIQRPRKVDADCFRTCSRY